MKTSQYLNFTNNTIMCPFLDLLTSEIQCIWITQLKKIKKIMMHK